jgi:hypothetical protein
MSVSICVCDFEGSNSVVRNFIPSERSKKERLRKLSVVGQTSSSYESYEMGCDVSDREDELRVQEPSMSKGFDSYTTPIQQPYNNPSHEGELQYVGPTLM